MKELDVKKLPSTFKSIPLEERKNFKELLNEQIAKLKELKETYNRMFINSIDKQINLIEQYMKGIYTTETMVKSCLAYSEQRKKIMDSMKNGFDEDDVFLQKM